MNILKKTLSFFIFTATLLSQVFASEGNFLNGFKVYGEFLYWQVSQDHMQYAAELPGGIQQIIDQIEEGGENLVITENLSIISPSFKYKPGFRVGIGYQAPCSNWEFDLIYLGLNQKVKSSVSDDANGIVALTVPASSVFGFINRDVPEFGFASEATSHWDFKYQSIDFQVGRVCNVCDCVQIRPYVGVKAASIKQKQKIQYFGFTLGDDVVDVENYKKNDFRGVGPSFGVESAWTFFENFNLTSGIGGALLYGKFDTSINPQIIIDTNSINVELKNNKKNRLRPVVDARIGLDWSSCLWDSFNFVIGVSYEVQYFWNQWQVPSSVGSGLITGGNGSQGDLMLQGLTVDLGFGF